MRPPRREAAAPAASAAATAALPPPEADELPAAPSDRRAALERLVADVRAGRGPAGPHALDLRGASLVEADLAGLDLSGADLAGADLTRARLDGARLVRARLGDATLLRASLEGAELAGADLAGACLDGAALARAGLGHARLARASLVGADLRGATLSDADLAGADLKVARLDGVRAREARLAGADLSRASLREADLTGCDVDRASLRAADLRGAALGGVRGYDRACWIEADVRDVDFNHAHLCRRHVLDQNYLEEFKNQGAASRLVYWVWWATSDCGRSLVRWGVLTATIALVFAALYSRADVDYGPHATPLSPLYYSVVTLTTLGYGDVLPTSAGAQLLCMVEVVLGYVMLGGLLSIFSNKMARRAE